MRLNLGCGFDIRKGTDWLNVDFTTQNGADMAYDLMRVPWPWGDGEIDEILALNLFEHLVPFDPIWHEIHRILRVGGTITIEVVNGNSWDPFHMTLWNRTSIKHLTNGYATSATPRHAFKKIDGPHYRHLPSGFPYWHIWHYLGITVPPIPGTLRHMSFTLEKVI